MGAEGLGCLLLLGVSPLELWEAFSRDSSSIMWGRNGSCISEKAQAATKAGAECDPHSREQGAVCLSGTNVHSC